MKLIELLKDQAAIFDAAHQLESLSAKKFSIEKNAAARNVEKVTEEDIKEAILRNLDKRLSLIYLSYQNDES